MGERSGNIDLVYVCDWLPPDFGAVGQYAVLFAREMAQQGQKIVLIGLTSAEASTTTESFGSGALTIVRLKARPYRKTRTADRIAWTVAANTRLLLAVRRWARRARTILFTGSPPLFLHWIAPANLVLRKRLVYRITDFHPECAIAERGGPPGLFLGTVLKFTLFWRRRVHAFEILGEDQRARLAECGVSDDRIILKPDPSPVAIPEGTAPLARPAEAAGRKLLLYSGNWGAAHDIDTFLTAYMRHHGQGSGRVLLWLNATGAGAAKVADVLTVAGAPFIRGQPVPIEQLAALMVTPDAHLICLKDAFVGYVLPSKVHACALSGQAVLFVGSARSDVDAICRRSSSDYARVDVGDADGLFAALEALGASA